MCKHQKLNKHTSFRRITKRWTTTLIAANGLMSEIYKIATAMLKITTVLVALTHVLR
jgi:hypothetical protein